MLQHLRNAHCEIGINSPLVYVRLSPLFTWSTSAYCSSPLLLCFLHFFLQTNHVTSPIIITTNTATPTTTPITVCDTPSDAVVGLADVVEYSSLFYR